MEKTYVFEGKTTTEAIEKGLKELKVSKNKVDIKVLESEEKRSFFSILTPRIVKVEMTLKDDIENIKEEKSEHKKENKVKFNQDEVVKKVEEFLDKLIENLPKRNLNYEVKAEEENILVNIDGEDTGYLIGYRGEVLNSLQNILTNIASKDVDGKVRIQLNISGYREKRKKDLENLADKIAKNVIKTKKSISIESMSAYVRKIIHLRLQDSDKVTPHSIGEEPYRKIVVSLKK